MQNYFLKLFLNYRNYLKQVFPQLNGYFLNGELFIKVPVNKLLNIIYFLKNHTQSQFKILSDICALDFPWKKNRFEIVYNLLSLTYNSRIVILVSVTEDGIVPSITSIYKVAGWFEREIWDLFGIYFSNHNDLRRILTDYGFKGHPLRKDFPLTGYTELRYFYNEKRIIVDEVTLTQDFKNFYFKNTWGIKI